MTECQCLVCRLRRRTRERLEEALATDNRVVEAARIELAELYLRIIDGVSEVGLIPNEYEKALMESGEHDGRHH
jgi:hypothetical protein